MKKSGLGRGLGSLIPKKEFVKKTFGENTKDNNKNSPDQDETLYVAIKKIIPNPHQPRRNFNQEKLKELSASIKEHGILQPLLVSRLPNENYELIAGERRLKAAQLAGLEKVPVIVKKVNDFEKLQLAIIENIQRSDLNPIEEALAFKELSDRFNMTHNDIAAKVGKSRAVVSNTLRLLNLPEKIQKALQDGKIGATQARSLVALPPEDQKKLFQKIISEEKHITSFDIENEARKVAVKKHIRTVKKDLHTISKEEELQRALGTKVIITKKGKRGKITIDFYSEEELESIVKKILS